MVATYLRYYGESSAASYAVVLRRLTRTPYTLLYASVSAARVPLDIYIYMLLLSLLSLFDWCQVVVFGRNLYTVWLSFLNATLALPIGLLYSHFAVRHSLHLITAFEVSCTVSCEIPSSTAMSGELKLPEKRGYS